VSFPEVLLSDVWTSLAKPLSDLVKAVAWIRNYSPDFTHSITGSFVTDLMLIVASQPYLVRIVQCCRKLNFKDPEISNSEHVINAFKYVMGICTIWIPYWTDSRNPWISLSVCLIYTIYACSWDFIQDWGLFQCCSDTHQRNWKDRKFPSWIYPIAIGINFLGRILGLIHPIALLCGIDANTIPWAVTMLQVGEVFRRSIWICFRVEWQVLRKSEEEEKSQ
jgi:hypothetical protein